MKLNNIIGLVWVLGCLTLGHSMAIAQERKVLRKNNLRLTKKAKKTPKRTVNKRRKPAAKVERNKRAARTSRSIGKLRSRRALRAHYRPAERRASPQVKAKLRALRSKIRKKRWKFDVGVTSVIDTDSKKLFMKPPSAEKLKASYRKVQARRKTKKPKNVSQRPRLCNATDSAYSFLDKVGPLRVGYQGSDCGSCWAWGASAAYEANYFLRNGYEPDVAEQHALSCTSRDMWKWATNSCETGGMHTSAMDWMVQKGRLAAEKQLPYKGVTGKCKNWNPKGAYGADAWDFVDPVNFLFPSVKKIKKALCEHGVVASGVYATESFKHYTGGVFTNDTKWKHSNHIVSIVGWDDKKGAWLIKNSWGTWGDNGFMWIKYGANVIGYGAAWIEASRRDAVEYKTCFEDYKKRVFARDHNFVYTKSKKGCKSGWEKNGLLCYPKCKAGTHAFGCCVCTQDCPKGWKDIGVSCTKPKAKGRGWGYALWHKGKCEKKYGKGNCEKCLAMYYPKCPSGYKPFGCNICTPKCPKGFRDDGAFCAKRKSYGRGAGKPMKNVTASCSAGNRNFRIVDMNGGQLLHGDTVAIRNDNGRFWGATVVKSLEVNHTELDAAEKFTILKASGKGLIKADDWIGLKSQKRKRFIHVSRGTMFITAGGRSLGKQERFRLRDFTRLPSGSDRPISLGFKSATKDYFSVMSAADKARAKALNYTSKAQLGYLYSKQTIGTIPMRLYYNASLKAHASVSSKADGELLKSAGYKLRSNDGLQGYILSDDPGRPGWIALNLYWNKKTKRALTATAAVAKNLKLKDYKRISAQGWVFSGLTAITVRKNIRRFIRKMK